MYALMWRDIYIYHILHSAAFCTSMAAIFPARYTESPQPFCVLYTDAMVPLTLWGLGLDGPTDGPTNPLTLTLALPLTILCRDSPMPCALCMLVFHAPPQPWHCRHAPLSPVLAGR